MRASRARDLQGPVSQPARGHARHAQFASDCRIWYACRCPRAPRSLHRSPFLARHAVHFIAIAAYHWHGVLLSFRTLCLFCTGQHPVAFAVGSRAEISVCSSRRPYYGPRGNGHSAGSPKRHAKKKTPMIISSFVRIFWCQWHHPTMPVTPVRTLGRGGRFLDSMSRTHSRHRDLIVYVYGV